MSEKIFCKIQSLHLYPIKSARGFSVDQIHIDAWGPKFDREWVIVDENGQFQSQRQTPQMAKIETALGSESLRVQVLGTDFFVPLKRQGQAVKAQIKVWKADIEADLQPVPGLDEAISTLLNKKCRLVRYGATSAREVIKSGQSYGVQMRFADAANFLMTTTASLRDLNSRLEEPVPMSRFRPNIVIDSQIPWQEDHWMTVNGQNAKLDVISGCGRCQIITQDPETGYIVSREPLTKLSEFRRQGNSINFGMHAISHVGISQHPSFQVGEDVEIEMKPPS